MKVLFFSPHAAVWDHAFPEALLAHGMQRAGHDVFYVTCGTTLKKYCICMAARNIRFEAVGDRAKEICRLCTENAKLIYSRFDFTGCDMESVLTAEDKVAAEKSVASITKDNLLDFYVYEIPVGRMALYEVLLHNKKANLDFSEDQWAHYKTAVYNCLLALYAAERILENEKPDRYICFASMYSVNHVWKALAEKKGIEPYLAQGGVNHSENRSTMILVRDRAELGIPYYDSAVKQWRHYQNAPVNEEAARKVAAHFMRLFGGTEFVFSPPRKNIKIREKLGIKNGNPLLVATMSSYDEILAAELVGLKQFPDEMIFSNQPLWARRLIEFAAVNKDINLVIRVHPREFPVKGSPVLSDQAKELQKILQHLPKNVKVNWPTDEISLYDVAEEASVILNGWSTVGSEMPVFGIPVVGYLTTAWYPADLNIVGQNESDYFSKILETVNRDWQPDLIRKGFRWFASIFYWGVFDFKETFSDFKSGAKNYGKRLTIDPLWFAQAAQSRASKFLGMDTPDLSTQKHFLRSVKLSDEFIDEIGGILTGNLDGVLDLRKTVALSGDVEAESLWLRKGVGSIVDAMIRSGRDDSPLVKNLLGYSKGEKF